MVRLTRQRTALPASLPPTAVFSEDKKTPLGNLGEAHLHQGLAAASGQGDFEHPAVVSLFGHAAEILRKTGTSTFNRRSRRQSERAVSLAAAQKTAQHPQENHYGRDLAQNHCRPDQSDLCVQIFLRPERYQRHKGSQSGQAPAAW